MNIKIYVCIGNHKQRILYVTIRALSPYWYRATFAWQCIHMS